MHAGRVRLRPILMTTFALIAGMMPVAIGVGEGGEFYRPMAVAIIGGTITSTLLTLLVIPSFYDSIEINARARAAQVRGARADLESLRGVPGDLRRSPAHHHVAAFPVPRRALRRSAWRRRRCTRWSAPPTRRASRCRPASRRGPSPGSAAAMRRLADTDRLRSADPYAARTTPRPTSRQFERRGSRGRKAARSAAVVRGDQRPRAARQSRPRTR